MPGLQERFSLFVFSRTQVVELPGSGPFEYVVVGFVPVDAAVIEVISLDPPLFGPYRLEQGDVFHRAADDACFAVVTVVCGQQIEHVRTSRICQALPSLRPLPESSIVARMGSSGCS